MSMYTSFSHAEELYNLINHESRALRETYGVINGDQGYDPMMATATADSVGTAPDLGKVIISREEWEDVLEYARFIGRGVDDYCVQIAGEPEQETEAEQEQETEAEWSVEATVKSGEIFRYGLEYGYAPALYWWPSCVTYYIGWWGSSDVVKATLYHNGEEVETLTKVGRDIHSQAIKWDTEAWGAL